MRDKIIQMMSSSEDNEPTMIFFLTESGKVYTAWPDGSGWSEFNIPKEVTGEENER